MSFFSKLKHALKSVSINNIKHLVLKFNPAVALLRLGMILIFELNLFHASDLFNLGLLTEDEAKKKKLDMKEWKKLQQKVNHALDNYEKSLGGSRGSMISAIKKGRHSLVKNKFSYDGSFDFNGYCDQFDFEPVSTAAAIAAATGSVLTIVKNIKSGVDVTKMTSKANPNDPDVSAAANPDVGNVTATDQKTIDDGNAAIAATPGLDKNIADTHAALMAGTPAPGLAEQQAQDSKDADDKKKKIMIIGGVVTVIIIIIVIALVMRNSNKSK